MRLPDPVQTILIWDVDDVLNDLTIRVLEELGVVNTGPVTSSFSNPRDYVLSLGYEEDTYLTCLDNVRRNVFHELKPNAEIQSWLQEHGSKYSHMALTSTPLQFCSNSASWVFAHFSHWIDSFGCTPSPRPTDPKGMRYRTKAEYLTRLSTPYILIDDTVSNLEQIDPINGFGLQFPTRWSSTQTIPECLQSISALR